MSATVVVKGSEVMSWSFLTSDIPNTASAGELQGDCAAQAKYGGDTSECEQASEQKIQPGIGPAVVGTIIVTALSALFAIPLGILAAVYLNEYGKTKPLARFVRFMTDVMTGVPSVIMGIFIYTFWVRNLGQGKSALAAVARPRLPDAADRGAIVRGDAPAGARTACVRAASALGARTWKTTMRVVLPSALPGLVSGSMLAVARAAGETAPVLFTIGTIYQVRDAFTVTEQSTTLSYQIYNLITNGGRLSPQMAWGAALTLIVMVLVLTIIARSVSARFTMR